MTPERIVDGGAGAPGERTPTREAAGPAVPCPTSCAGAGRGASCGRAASTRWRPPGSTACRSSPATRRSRCCPTARRTACRSGRRTCGRPPSTTSGSGYMTELLTATSHSGAHIDALAHMTVGEDAHWYGGANAAEHLGDFGPTVGDAAALPPIFTRGRAARRRRAPRGGVPARGQRRRRRRGGRDRRGPRRPGDPRARRRAVPHRLHGPVAGRRRAWPSTARPARTCPRRTGSWNGEWWRSAATPRRSRCSPPPTPATPANPQPVHTRLLIESGVYIMESLDLERARGRRGARVPVRRAPAQDRGRDRLDARSARRRLRGGLPGVDRCTPACGGEPRPAVAVEPPAAAVRDAGSGHPA